MVNAPDQPNPEQCFALAELGRWLRAQDYCFITTTPASHARVMARNPRAQAGSLRDIFGWSRTFEDADLPAECLRLLGAAGALARVDGGLRSRVRFSTLGQDLFVHSAYPTSDADAVFFGPDTYRFARLIRQVLQGQARATSRPRIVDVGCGSGAGGLYARRLLEGACELTLTDISSKALDHARVNAALAGAEGVSFLRGDLFEPVQAADLIIANPPYLLDAQQRMYRDGGGQWGSALSLRIVAEGIPKLGAGGTLVLYTGVPIVEGRDLFREAVEPVLRAAAVDFSYEEIDPDVFGEELDNPAYREIDRIACIGLVARKAGHAPGRRADITP